jgi:uncharacterized membrane protein YdbT with pleckstrin-like domain
MWYVVRGIGGAIVMGFLLRVGMPLVAGGFNVLGNSLPVSVGRDALAVVFLTADWLLRLAPGVAGAWIVVGVLLTVAGGIKREYRATPGCLTMRRSTFSRVRTIDVDSITAVEVRSGPVARLFRGGTLRIETKAGPVRIVAVTDPDGWAAALRPGTSPRHP